MVLTPSALSVVIRELENHVGTRLFDRTTRHVSLTPTGAALLQAAQRSLRELDEAIAQIADASPAEPPIVAIGAVPLFASSVVPEAIRAFRQLRPNLRYQLLDADAGVLAGRMAAGTLDVALGVFLAHMPGIRRTPLFRFSMYAVRSSSRPNSGRGRLPWTALKGRTVIALHPSIPLQGVIDKHLARAGVADAPRLIVNSFRTVVAMAEAGEGIGIIPSYWLPVCRERSVVTSRLCQPVLQLDFHQLRRSGRRLAPATEEFVTFLQEYCAGWAERSRMHSQ